MYPLAHLYFMEQSLAEFSLDKLDDAIVLGSIFPDLVILSGLDWRTSHSLGMRIWRGLHKSGEEQKHFALGVACHGIEPRGLDYYSDEKYKSFERGYCYEKARPLVEDVIEACSITSRDGWWKAHNFIEMGVELYIYKKRPELFLNLSEAFSSSPLITSLIRELSPLLNINKDLLLECFDRFGRFAVTEPVNAKSMALRYQRQIYFRNKVESININRSGDLIEEGERIVLPDIEDFFHDVKNEMASVRASFL